MQAIRVHAFGDESALGLETLPTPSPAPGQALIALKAVGVNPVETYIRSGKYPALPALPYTPGMDAAGVVEAIAPDVTTFKPGDRVYLCGSLTGTYATHALVTVATHIKPLPDSYSFEQGAALYIPYYTAYKAAFLRGNIRPGDTVLIHGATGAVGLAALQWLRNLNVTLLASGGSPQGRELLKAQGAHYVLDHKNPSYLEDLHRLAPNGIDVILEMLANVNLAADLKLLTKHGRVIVIGNRGETTLNARDIMAKDADIRAMSLGSSSPEDLALMHRAVAMVLAQQALDPIIAHRFPLADAAKAHHAVMNTSATGKIVLTV